MNRKNLTSAVLAGLAGAVGIAATAQAVNVNPDGLGQVLIYPYYTTNGGNDTLLSVVNTSADAKAVKVRFSEGQNTREVLDFNLYLSPFDVWTAALVDDDGTPTMLVTDLTCTVPYIVGADYLTPGEQAFLNFAMNDIIMDDDDELVDDEFDDISRAAEGHFEIIEMGTLGEGTELVPDDPDTDDDEEVETDFLDCGSLVAAWTRGADPDDDGYWIGDPEIDISPPSGGLFGGAAIINVERGTMYSYDAIAINGWNNTGVCDNCVNDKNTLHEEPGFVTPNLNSGDNTVGKVFSSSGGVLISPGIGDALDRPVDAVSYVFMHDQIMNEYITLATIGAGTEWVLTFPTKNFYVYQPDYDAGFDEFDDEDGLVPFTSNWIPGLVAIPDDPETVVDDSVAAVPVTLPCEVVLLKTIWDREEQDPGDADLGPDRPPIVSPAPPPGTVPGIVPFELCYETSVIRFGDPDDVDLTTEILGSSNFHSIDNEVLGFDYGWARLELVDYSHDSAGIGVIDDLRRENLGGLAGLPVTGFAVMEFENSFLGEGADVLANYGGIFKHKGTRLVSAD